MSQGRPTQEAWCQNPHNCCTHWAQHLTHHLHKQYMLIGICWFWWTTSWRMWWCIRCLGRAIFRYINDSAAVHVDKEHPGDCPTVLDAWAKQCWGVQLYKWFAVASWLLCGSAYPQILRNSKKMWLNTHLYTFLEICWCYYQWCVRCLICNISLCDFQMKEIRFYCILSYIFLESIC